MTHNRRASTFVTSQDEPPGSLASDVVGAPLRPVVGQGHFPPLPEKLPGRRPDQALRERPVGLVRSLLQIRQTLGPGDVDVEVEVLDVDVDVVRRCGRRLRSPDCPG